MPQNDPKIRRAISMHELFNTKFQLADFQGQWLEFMGRPELSQTWFVYGNSSNGKTTFTLMLAKYLSTFDKVLYNSVEEGLSESFRLAVSRAGISPNDKNIMLLDQEPIDALVTRLKRRKSPNIIVIDSVQEAQMKFEDYRLLRDTFPEKLIIYISRADGKNPEGATARAIKYCANVKIWVEGYMATCRSRYGGEKPFTIWQQGADRYYGLTNEYEK